MDGPLVQGVAAVAGPTSSKSVEPRPSSPPDTFPRGCDQMPSGDCQRPDAPVPREEGPQELHRPAVSVPVLRTWLDAAKDGDVRQLAALLRAYPDLLNTRAGGLGAGALHWAAAKGHTDAVGLLLAAGADVLSTTTTRATPLHAAAGAGRSEACELLLAAAGPAAAAALLSAANEDSQTPAALALQHGHRMTHSMLVSAAEAMHVDAMGGASPLAHPSQSDVMQTAGLLLSRGQRWRPSVSHGWQRADGGGSALISDSDSSSEWVEEAEGEGDAGDASEAGDKHTTSGAGGHDRADGPLLQQGAAAPIKAAAPLDRSLGRAWLDAARAGDVARLASLLSAAPELLLYRGEGCSYAVIGNSALHWAAANGHHGALTWLLERLGSEAASLLNQAGGSALHSAAGHGQARAAHTLVLHGLDVHAPDALAESAVQAAEACGEPGLAQRLLLWDAAARLHRAERPAWPTPALHALAMHAGRATEAAACGSRAELEQLAEQLISSVLGAVHGADSDG